MWAAIPFFSALILLAVFIGFRSWELRQEKHFFSTFRTTLDEKVLRFYKLLVTGSIPTTWKMTTIVFIHSLTHKAVVVSVEILRAIERPLTRLSHRLRTRPPSSNGKEVSSFLKNISPPTPEEGRGSDLPSKGSVGTE